MKKQLSIHMLVALLAAGIFLTAAAFQQKEKSSNEQGQGKGNQKLKNGMVQPGRPEGVAPGQAKVNPGNAAGNQGKSNSKGNDKAGINNTGKDKMSNDGPGNSGNRGRAKIVNLNGNGNNWYSWTNDNFRNRKELRKKEKVTICHKFNSKDEPVTISVSANAVEAHRQHGDIVGGCPAVNNSIFSDIFRKRRADYYSDLYYGQDQYNYSSSILDYALMRLNNSQSQLEYMRANNAPQADIVRSQGAIVQLEENVSLLETLLGVAGQVLVNRL
jgi:hypothetical protein